MTEEKPIMEGLARAIVEGDQGRVRGTPSKFLEVRLIPRSHGKKHVHYPESG
ncbi:MAG: hypothetical protein GTO13_18465 [Proteobacteria bacterium]|nr:hypothetical protein [Pseudomonadota bacterium]